MSRIADVYVSAYPNAGLPNAFGEYDEAACETAELIRDFAASGFVNIVGGCCGTTPEHIRHIKEAVAGLPPRQPPQIEPRLRLSGLEPLNIGADSLFVNVGERTNVTGSAKFRKLIEADDYNAALDVARQQVASGAQIDRHQHGRGHARFGSGDGALPEPDRRRARHRARADHDRLVEVDGHRSGPEVHPGQGHRQLHQPEGRRGAVPAARAQGQRLRRGGRRDGVRREGPGRYGRAQGRRSASARTSCSREQAGFPPEDIIFDPNIFAVATGIEEHNNYALDFIEATAAIRKACPHAHISGGVSNVSFSFRGNDPVREAMHSVFLYHAIKAGMTMGIVNAGQLAIYEDIEPELRERVEDVILNRRPDATERLLEIAARFKGDGGRSARPRTWPGAAGRS